MWVSLLTDLEECYILIVAKLTVIYIKRKKRKFMDSTAKITFDGKLSGLSSEKLLSKKVFFKL